MQIVSLFPTSILGSAHEKLFSSMVHIWFINDGEVKKILSVALDNLPVSLPAGCNSVLGVSCCVSKQTLSQFSSC